MRSYDKSIFSFSSNEDADVSGFGISFLLGLNYKNNFSLHGSYFGTDLVSSRHSLIGVPNQKFVSEKFFTSDVDSAIVEVEKRIRVENDNCPEFCDGLEVMLVDGNGIKTKRLEGISL